MAAMPTHSNTHPLFPIRHVRAHSVDETHDFVARHPGIFNTRNRARHREHVAVADAASLHLDAYLPGLRLGYRTLDDFEAGVGFGNLGNLHGSFL
jgi:hypothetical protein